MNIPKFRAWDKVNKKMIDCEDILSICFRGKEISIEHVGIFDENAIPHIRTIIFKLEDIKLMQSTGLKDKNGVEIFEGDIIECWSEGVRAIGEVKRRIDGWWFMYPAWQHNIMWGLCPDDIGNTTVKVIGNIYENPELLEGVEQ